MTEEEQKEKRKELAAELGELTLERAELADQLNKVITRQGQIAVEIKQLAKE